MTQAIQGVCFVAPELDRIGGYELATLALAHRVRQRGIPVVIVTTTKISVPHRQDADLIRIEARGRLGDLLIFPRLLMVLMRQRVNFSIVHCSTFGYLSGLAVLAGRVLRRPTLLRVATENDVREFSEGRHLKSRVFFYLLRGATGVIAPSGAIRTELLAARFPHNKIFVLPNGVDVERFRPAMPGEQAEAKRALNLIADKLIIGTVARLVQRKGMDVLLRAFVEVLKNHRAQLVIVGDGPLAVELRALACDLKIDSSVTWVGLRVDPENWLRAMDVFAFPSRLEGSPNAVLEAMATGLPIVATAIGGVKDLIQEGVSGLLAPPNDPETLAAALERMAADATLRTNLGSHARSRAVEVFALDKTLSSMIDLYTSLATQS